MNIPPDVGDDEYSLSISLVVALAVICFYIIGVYLHIKIIIVSKKEKSAITWKLDITNSILVLGFYTFFIFNLLIIHVVEDLYVLTGQWLCYGTTLMIDYHVFYMLGHSLVIVVMKYTLIIHEEKTRTIKETIKKVFFLVNVCHPIISIVLTVLIIPDFYPILVRHGEDNSCLSVRLQQKLSTCWSIIQAQNNFVDQVWYHVQWMSCNILLVFRALIALNILEVCLYIKIFTYMRR